MHRSASSPLPILALVFLCLFVAGRPCARAQQLTVEGKSFTQYKPGYFKTRKKLQYNIYLSPVLTVDPLGLGGKSTYGVGAGSRIILWESRAPDNLLQGLRVKGLYAAVGYEYFPLQSDNVYGSLWLRVKTFMPVTARLDYVFSYGDGLRGTSTRYCFGFEVKQVSLLLAGSITRFLSPLWGEHPYLESPYANAGSILLVIPLYKHYPQVK